MINPLPSAPAATDAVDVFDAKAFAFAAALVNFVTQANALATDVQKNADVTAALALGMALPNYGGTSTSNLTIGTGAVSVQTQAGKSWVAGQVVVISNGGNYMKGSVTAYSGTQLDVNVTSVVGAGTFASWTIGLSYAGLALAASGANSDITSLNALAVIPSVVAKYAQQIKSLPDPTLAANAMTLPASTHTLDFRSATLTTGVPSTVTGTAAALVIPAGATLGTVNAVQSTLVEVIINNGGTLEKAVVNLAGGNDLSETGVISTTAISGASTAANVFYSTTARSNVPYRVVRTITSTQATAGQWATNPSLVQGQGGQALSAMSSPGYGQTWQDVTGSRASGTTYYNTTGRPIFVSFSSNTTVASNNFFINGVQMGLATVIGTGGRENISFQVPSGNSYSITAGSGIAQWSEMR